MRIDRLQREYGVAVRWAVFPLHPEIPLAGMELSALFPGRAAKLKEMQERLSRQAAKEGLELRGERSRTYNSRLAQELGKWAEAEGKGEPFHRAVYRAFFVEGSNIAQINELVRIAKSVGLPVDGVLEVLGAQSFAAAVDSDWQRAKELAITAVPTHLCGTRRLEGFSPYEEFERLIGR